jgi:diguanylate cyclase (GGDEF)-like protein
VAQLNPFTTALTRLAEPRRVVPVLLVAIAAIVIAGGLSWRSLAAVCLVAIAWSFAYLDARDRRRVADELALVHEQLADTAHRAQQRADEISRLAELTQLLQTCELPEEAYRVIERAAPALVQRDGALFVINNSNTALERRAQWGSFDGLHRSFEPADCWALRRNRLHDTGRDPSAPHCIHLDGLDAAHSTCVPLIAQGDAIGVLSLIGPPSGADSDGEDDREYEDRLRIITAMSEQIGLSLANLRLRETLKNQSIRDPLTGLFNRRFLEESLDRECRRSVRAGRPLSVLMLDIDYFKRFNDTFGHDAGDAVLREVGSVTRSVFRGEDVACRYGGEEFALVLAGTTAEGALQRANTLRDRVRAISLTYRHQTLGPLSISVGVATLPLHGVDGLSLLHAADLALYRAKRDGRDRVVIAELSEPSNIASAETGLS